MAYDYGSIQLEGLKAERIEELEITAKKGEHTLLTIKVLVEEEQAIHKILENSPIQVYVNGEEKKLLFDGVMVGADLHVINGVYELTVTAKNQTYWMDIERHSRSFQQLSMTYHQVIQQVMQAYQGADCILEIPNTPIGELLVQYEETDWEFIKRLVSVQEEAVFAVADSAGIKFYAGVPELDVNGLSKLHWSVKKEMEGYYRREAQQNGSAKETDYVVFCFDSYEFAGIGSHLTIKNQTVYLRKYQVKLEAGLVVVHYEAQRKGGIRQRKLYPMQLVGAAIRGRILRVEGDKVKVWLEIDASQSEATAYRMPYSTVSASNDGSGWYCMPEMNDLVEVYFPTKYTKDAVALSSVSEYEPMEKESAPDSGGSGAGAGGSSGGGADRMGDPTVLFLSNVHGKEVQISPAGVNVSCGGGSFSLTSAGDLCLSAKKKVEIKAEESMEIKAGAAMMLTALESMELSCDQGAKLTLSETADLKGTKVKLD